MKFIQHQPCQRHLPFRGQVLCAMLLTIGLPPVYGCGQSGPGLVPVAGKITLHGAPLPKAGVLYFAPVGTTSDQPQRPGMARFDTDGNFRAGMLGKSDGLLPGHYKISVECWEVAPTMNGPPSKSFVPMQYQAATTSGLELTLEAGVPQEDIVLSLTGVRSP